MNRRARRAKTDRTGSGASSDALVSALCLRASRGCAAWCGCPRWRRRIAQRRTRERERLLKERNAHVQPHRAWLCWSRRARWPALEAGLRRPGRRCWTGEGRVLPPGAEGRRSARAAERLELVHKQIRALEAAKRPRSRHGQARAEAGRWSSSLHLKRHWPANRLGAGAARCFYRRFDNRRQVGGCFGLTATPYDSGASRRRRASAKPATSGCASCGRARLATGCAISPTASSAAGSAARWRAEGHAHPPHRHRGAGPQA